MVSTELPEGAHLVRIHPSETEGYDRMIVVVEQDEGQTLFLLGWVGKPLTPKEWRRAAAGLFPKAKVVRFERRTRGQTRLMEVRL